MIETLIKEKKIEVRVSGNQELVRKIQRDFRIEAGEAEALCLARTLNCVIAVDDGPTIKACRVLGQKFATAIHFLLNMASRNKLDVHVAEVKLEQLARFGRYSKRILEDASERLKGGKKMGVISLRLKDRDMERLEELSRLDIRINRMLRGSFLNMGGIF